MDIAGYKTVLLSAKKAHTAIEAEINNIASKEVAYFFDFNDLATEIHMEDTEKERIEHEVKQEEYNIDNMNTTLAEISKRREVIAEEAAGKAREVEEEEARPAVARKCYEVAAQTRKGSSKT